MKSCVKPTTEQRLLDYALMRRLDPPDAMPMLELTETLKYAIDANLPQTLSALLRELGRRGGLVVSVEPAAHTVARNESRTRSDA
jgi:hypothetical protein